MNMSGICYEIEIDSAITNGAVVSNFRAAFPGTAVTLVVTPEPGYGLKPGTLTYNYGAAGVSISREPYRFIMPDGDTRVGAQFVRGDLDVGFDW
jgi:hypothetical protein